MPPYKTALATGLREFCDDGLAKHIIDIVNDGKEGFSDSTVAQTGINTTRPPKERNYLGGRKNERLLISCFTSLQETNLLHQVTTS